MTNLGEPSRSLSLARAWYGLLGAGALMLTAGEIVGDLSPGATVDLPNLAAGTAVGMLMLAAAAWVVAAGRTQTILAWLGIVAGVLPFALLLWIALNTASPDAIALAVVPTVLAMLAGVRMALARAGA